MSLRPASREEIDIWHQWLWLSHGLRTLSGLPIFRYEKDSPLLLVPWWKFEDFALRLDRHTSQITMTFRLDQNIRTIAGFWFRPGTVRMPYPRHWPLDYLESSLIVSAAAGQVWWGTEFPSEGRTLTSTVYWFSPSFSPPEEIRPLKDCRFASA